MSEKSLAEIDTFSPNARLTYAIEFVETKRFQKIHQIDLFNNTTMMNKKNKTLIIPIPIKHKI